MFLSSVIIEYCLSSWQYHTLCVICCFVLRQDAIKRDVCVILVSNNLTIPDVNY